MLSVRRRDGFLSHVTYRFVDCRWALDDPGFGRRAYLEAHIPGAAFLDVDRDLAAPAGQGGRHPLPSAEQFAAAASRAGIGPDTFVVAYGSLGGAERLWWLLRHFGHGDCAVIDLDGWHGPLIGGEETIEPAVFEPREREGDTISREELAERRSELVVVDARVEPRWRGEPNPVDRVPGRIPGALNRPWNRVGDGSTQTIPAGGVVAYCGSGITACVVLHRLHLAGRDGILYPGSWSEWEQYPELPVERST
jgi:thiosulfate/3-mercaptopyruvate sulfurtransferase